MRSGVDAKLSREKVEDDPDLKRRHTIFNVYSEMLLQCCVEYPALPDPRSLTMAEIRFFYDGIRPLLKRHTKESS